MSVLESILFAVRFYGPVNPMGSGRAVSSPNHTLTGEAKSSKWLTSNMHILSPESVRKEVYARFDDKVIANQ